MKRRRFFVLSLKTGAAMAIPFVYSSCDKDEEAGPLEPGESLTIDLDSPQYSQLKTDGHAVNINNVVVANLGNGEFVALSAICTHRGCIISYNHAAGNFPCPCHGSVFSTSGSVLQGPATTAVKRYTVSREGNILTIQA